jgi:protein-arginine kinase activator protein McsA
MQCDQCEKLAVVHLTEIDDGKKIERHLCLECAAQNNPAIKSGSIKEILERFVDLHSKKRPDQPPK